MMVDEMSITAHGFGHHFSAARRRNTMYVKLLVDNIKGGAVVDDNLFF